MGRKLKAKIQLPSYLDGSFFSLMVGVAETYLVAGALAYGVSEKYGAWLAILPLFFSSMLQFFSAFGVRLLGSLKKWIVSCALVQAGSLFFAAYMVVAGVDVKVFAEIFFGTVIVYWTSNQAAGIAWNAWIGQIISPADRVKFFSTRAAVLQLLILIGLVVAGFVLRNAPNNFGSLKYFSVLFFLGGTFRLFSTYYLWIQPQGKQKRAKIGDLETLNFGHSLSVKNWPREYAHLLIFLFVFNLAAHISAPLVNPYLLNQLRLSYGDYTVLIAVTFLARVVVSYLTPYIVKYLGTHSLMIIATVMIAPNPYFWTLSDNYGWLLFLQITAGFAWGVFELGVTLSLMDRIDHLRRVHFLNWSNFLNACGMVVGMMVASWTLDTLPLTKDAYFSVFIVATWARVFTIFLIPLWYQQNSTWRDLLKALKCT